MRRKTLIEGIWPVRCALCAQGVKLSALGFSLAPGLVATAYHIFKNIDENSNLFCVFGYYISELGQQGFPDTDIYQATLSSHGSYDICSTDWACLDLGVEPPGRPPLSVNPSGGFGETVIFAIAHPQGEPAKISEDCAVGQTDDDCFVIDLMSERDASGGPVFNSGNRVEGIIREG